jgi:hypothetical protein
VRFLVLLLLGGYELMRNFFRRSEKANLPSRPSKAATVCWI